MRRLPQRGGGFRRDPARLSTAPPRKVAVHAPLRDLIAALAACYTVCVPGVAQIGSALEWGSRVGGSNPPRPDQRRKSSCRQICGSFLYRRWPPLAGDLHRFSVESTVEQCQFATDYGQSGQQSPRAFARRFRVSTQDRGRPADYRRRQPGRRLALHACPRTGRSLLLSRHSQLYLVALPQRCHGPRPQRRRISRCSSRR